MKKLLFLIFLLSGIQQNIFAQKNKGNIQEPISESLSNVSLSCKECKEIVDLYHDAFIKGISINSIDFFPMKALIENCYKNNLKECGGKMEEKLNLLSGNLAGGPSSYGEDSRWRIPSSIDFSKLKISKNDAIDNFKKSYTENLVQDCSECTEIVDKFYTSFVNKTNLNEAEFNLLKSKVQICMNQKSSECGSKMGKQLAVLTGNLEGGPTSYGDDSKWRISEKKIWKFDSDSDFKNIMTLSSNDVIFSYKNLYGVKDKNGLVFIYPKYEKIEYIKFNNSDYLIVSFEKKIGVMDMSGNLKLPIEYIDIESNKLNPRILIYKSFNNNNGVVFGDFVKREILNYNIFFLDRFCVISKDSQYGFVDNFGNIIIEPKYDKVSFIGEKYYFKYLTTDDVFLSSDGGVDLRYIPSNDVLVVKKDNKLGLIGGAQLEEVLSPKYEMIGHKNIITSKCIKGLIPIWENGKMGYVNDRGKVLISPIYDEINGFGVKGVMRDKISFVKKDNKWGIFSNETLQELTPIQYDNIVFNGDLAEVRVGEKYGVIDIGGKEIIKPQYDKIIGLDTKNSFLILQNAGLFGLVKNDGTVITPLKYQSIKNNFGYWIVKLDNKMGMINNSGILIIQPKYQEISEFKNGLASVKLNGKYGIVNEQGVEIINPLYDYPFEFVDGYATVSFNGKSYRIDTKNEKVIDNFTNSSYSSLIEGTKPLSKNDNSENRFVRVGQIDVMTQDLGELNYFQAKDAIQAMGGGWRLPTESELILMFNNQEKIGPLSKKPVSRYDGKVYWGNYLGGSFDSYYVTLLTYINAGLTNNRTWSVNSKQNEFYFVRPVRDMSSKEQVKNMISSYSEVLKIAKKQGVNVAPDSENSIKNCECCRKKFSTKGYNIRKSSNEIIDASYYAGMVIKPVFCSRVCAANLLKDKCK